MKAMKNVNEAHVLAITMAHTGPEVSIFFQGVLFFFAEGTSLLISCLNFSFSFSLILGCCSGES
jgi:hypothetical protein